MQTYCTKCKTTKKFFTCERSFCLECKTVLKYKCGRCKRLYKKIDLLQQHLQEKHSPEFFILNERNKYYCEHCKYKTCLKTNLNNHIEKNHLSGNHKSNKCYRCGRKLFNADGLKRHLKICGKTQDEKQWLKKYSCDNCEYKTDYKKDIFGHMVSKHLPHDSNLSKCNKCGKRYSRLNGLYRHLKICGVPLHLRRLPVRYFCDHCEFKTPFRSHLSNHILIKHLPRDPSNKCSNCKKIFSCKSVLVNHLKICGPSPKSRSPSFFCDNCEYKTNFKTCLVTHMQSKHLPKVQKSYSNKLKCTKCGNNYTSRGSLKSHSKICGKTQKFKQSLRHFFCDLCDYKSHRKSLLSTHIQKKHLPRNSKSHVCSKCGKNFESIRTLNMHSRICGKTREFKRSLKRFSCDHCGQRSCTKASILTHIIAKHLNHPYAHGYLNANEFEYSKHFPFKASYRRFSCDECNYKGWTEKQMLVHKKACHLNDKPNLNTCNKCKISFSTRLSLLSHMKRLCGIELLHCDHCDFKCYKKDFFAQHIYTKHMDDSRKCSKCAKIFSLRSNMLNHFKLCGKTKGFKLSLMRFSCHHCRFKTNEKLKISDHIKAKHLPRDPNSNKCTKCGRSYTLSSNLNKHFKICGLPLDLRRLPKKLFCDYCDYKCNHKPRLANHIQTKHLPKNSNLITCNKCNKKFNSKTSLYRHSKICGRKDNLQQFSCDMCDYKTDYKNHLPGHIQRKHSVGKPHFGKCSKCNKMRANLTKYSKLCKACSNSLFCDHCGYRTYDKKYLINHVKKKHLFRDVSLNLCKKCGKNYSIRSRHLEFCGVSSIFSCEQCDYETNLKANLKHHTRRMHLPRDLNSNKCK